MNRRTFDWFSTGTLLLVLLALPKAVAAATPAWHEPAGGPITLLLADFNDKTVGQPIGTGGAAVGEPAYIDFGVSAIVEQPVGANRVLALEADALPSASGAVFKLLGGTRIEEGTAVISVALAFPSLCSFNLYVRERDSSAQNFTTLVLSSDGSISAVDENGPVGQIGNYSAGQILRISIEHDLDAGTYDVLLNDAVLLDDRAHGVVGEAIGKFLMKFEFAQPPTRVLVDNVMVEASVPPDLIFDNGFESANPF